MEEKFLLSEEVMFMLRISRSTLLRMLADGRLIGYKLHGGQRWMFKETEVRATIRRAHGRPLPDTVGQVM